METRRDYDCYKITYKCCSKNGKTKLVKDTNCIKSTFTTVNYKPIPPSKGGDVIRHGSVTAALGGCGPCLNGVGEPM